MGEKEMKLNQNEQIELKFKLFEIIFLPVSQAFWEAASTQRRKVPNSATGEKIKELQQLQFLRTNFRFQTIWWVHYNYQVRTFF